MVKRDLMLGKVAPVGEDLSPEEALRATKRIHSERKKDEPNVVDLSEFLGKREPTQEEIEAEVKRIRDINERYKPYFETLQKFNATDPLKNITDRDIDILLKGAFDKGEPREINKDKDSLKESLLQELKQHLDSIKDESNGDILRAKNELRATMDHIAGL